MTQVALVAAVAENGVIGRAGGLPWRLPDDLRHFRQLTTGHVLIMGRRTWESIGRALPGRRTIVLSRDPTFQAGGGARAPSLDAALAAASDADCAFVVGGASVYAAAMPHADRMHLTVVHADVPGDVTFPTVDWTDWILIAEETHLSDARHPFAFTIRRYDRK